MFTYEVFKFCYNGSKPFISTNYFIIESTRFPRYISLLHENKMQTQDLYTFAVDKLNGKKKCVISNHDYPGNKDIRNHLRPPLY